MAAMAVLVVIAYLTAPRLVATKASFRRVDVLAALALLATAAFIGTEFRVGRLVRYSFPVHLAVVAVVVDEWLCVRHDHA